MRFNYPYEITKLYAKREEDKSQVDTEINYAFAVQENFDTIRKYLNEIISGDNLEANLKSGWMSAEGDKTWTYTSPTTFTTGGDRTNIYQTGDRIKLTQGSTEKYFNIIGVSYSSGNTTITIDGGTSYTLADASITNNYYSKTGNPQGFPVWFNWTPTYSAGGSMTYTSVTTLVAKYCKIHKIIYFDVCFYGTTGGTAATYLYLTLPNIPITSLILGGWGGGCVAYDSLPEIAGTWNIDDYNPPSIIVYRYDGANFGLGTNRGGSIQGFYEID